MIEGITRDEGEMPDKRWIIGFFGKSSLVSC